MMTEFSFLGVTCQPTVRISRLSTKYNLITTNTLFMLLQQAFN